MNFADFVLGFGTGSFVTAVVTYFTVIRPYEKEAERRMREKFCKKC